mgnify:CR=1 FL=1
MRLWICSERNACLVFIGKQKEKMAYREPASRKLFQNINNSLNHQSRTNNKDDI